MYVDYNGGSVWFDEMDVTELVYRYEEINVTDTQKVQELVESIKSDGYIGCPILVYGGSGTLITGSHRLAALRKIVNELYDEYLTFDKIDAMYPCVAIDVTDAVDAICLLRNCTIDELPLDNLQSWMDNTILEPFGVQCEEW